MKRKYFVLVFIVLMMFTASPVLARNITSCNTTITGAIIDEKIPNTVATIINVIKIAVPILLVIFGSIDLMNGIIAAKDDEIKKGQQTFIKRLIAGALVFFVFAVVQFLISLVASGANERTNIMTCANCFINKECTYSE